jgi:non-specific serine/threonine protein kinase
VSCVTEPEVLDLLTRLVEKSLVVYEGDEQGRGRYRLLETMHQYARDRMVESGETEDISPRHLGFYLSLAEEASLHLFGTEQTAYQTQLEREDDNLRAALEWSLAWDKGVEAALRLVSTLGQFWLMGSHLREGGEWATRSLARGRDAPPRVLARVLVARWRCEFFRGDYETARSLAEEALRFAGEARDHRAIVSALFYVELSAVHLGELEAALSSAEEGLRLAQAVGDRLNVSYHLALLGLVGWTRGDYSAARVSFRKSLEISRALEDAWHIGMNLANLGFVTGREGDWEAAQALHLEGLPVCQRLDDRRGIAWHLAGMAGVEAARTARSRRTPAERRRSRARGHWLAPAAAPAGRAVPDPGVNTRPVGRGRLCRRVDGGRGDDPAACHRLRAGGSRRLTPCSPASP